MTNRTSTLYRRLKWRFQMSKQAIDGHFGNTGRECRLARKGREGSRIVPQKRQIHPIPSMDASRPSHQNQESDATCPNATSLTARHLQLMELVGKGSVVAVIVEALTADSTHPSAERVCPAEHDVVARSAKNRMTMTVVVPGASQLEFVELLPIGAVQSVSARLRRSGLSWATLAQNHSEWGMMVRRIVE